MIVPGNCWLAASGNLVTRQISLKAVSRFRHA